MTIEERLEKYLGKDPQIDPTAYVSRRATLVGDVKIGKNASVWPGCVLRADINSIELGENSNIQDGTMVHLADDAGVKIGRNTTIGHGAVIHACTIGDGCLIGMGSIILDKAVIGDNCIVGAGGARHQEYGSARGFARARLARKSRENPRRRNAKGARILGEEVHQARRSKQGQRRGGSVVP